MVCMASAARAVAVSRSIEPLLYLTPTLCKAASEAWGFNSGIAALCAITQCTPEQIRPHLGDFEQRRYTSPLIVKEALEALCYPVFEIYRAKDNASQAPGNPKYPAHGVVRIQWAGPWTEPNAPKDKRRERTHWIATRQPTFPDEPFDVFDINMVKQGGWTPWSIWVRKVAPWILKYVEGSNGDWWPTHSWEVLPPADEDKT